MSFSTRGRWVVTFAACCCIAGCVIVPYKPKAEIVETQDVAIDPATIMVTLGPRQLVEDITEAIADEDGGIRIVPEVEFLNVAVPGDDLTLQGLLASGNAQRAREQTGADYLVLVGEKKEYTTDEFGGIVPYLGFYGLYKGNEHTTLVSTIIDLARAQPLSDVSAHAQGTSAGAGAFYGLFIIPMTGSSARDGMARGIVASLRHAAGPGPLAIAVAAGERIGSDEPPCDEEHGDDESCTGVNARIDALLTTPGADPAPAGSPSDTPAEAPDGREVPASTEDPARSEPPPPRLP